MAPEKSELYSSLWSSCDEDYIRAKVFSQSTGLEADMTDPDDHAAVILKVLKRAVAEALERKRRLGQYAVVWRNGRAVFIGPDAPPMRYSSGTEAARTTGVVESGKDD